MEKIIYLVRHGQASAGTHDYDRLSDIGQAQARLIGEHWKSCQQPPTEAFAGTLLRQRDTAILAGSIAREAIEDQTHHGLDEYDHKQVHAQYAPNQVAQSINTPTQEGQVDLSASTTFEDYSQIVSNWRTCRAIDNSGTESFQEFKRRTLQAVIDCTQQSSAGALALYTSGGAISVITSQIEQLPESALPRRIWDMHNASITTLVYRSGQLAVKELNDISHLEKHADPALLTLI